MFEIDYQPEGLEANVRRRFNIEISILANNGESGEYFANKLSMNLSAYEAHTYSNIIHLQVITTNHANSV